VATIESCSTKAEDRAHTARPRTRVEWNSLVPWWVPSAGDLASQGLDLKSGLSATNYASSPMLFVTNLFRPPKTKPFLQKLPVGEVELPLSGVASGASHRELVSLRLLQICAGDFSMAR